MVELNILSRGEHEAAAQAALALMQMPAQRVTGSEVLIARATSFIGTEPGWIAGACERPPRNKHSTSSGNGTDQKNEYFTELALDHSTLPALAAVPGDIVYCTPSGAGGVVVDVGGTALNLNLYPTIRLTYAGAFAPGNPAVGALISITAHTRETGVQTCSATVVAHDTGNKRLDLLLRNNITLANGDRLSDGVNTYTVNTTNDTIGDPGCKFPSQRLAWSGSESGTFGLGDKVVGTDATGTVNGIVTDYSNSSNYINVVPTAGTGFRVGMTIANSSSGATAPALTSVTWDTIKNGANTAVLTDTASIVELTRGSLAVPNDPTRPTVKPAEMGVHWPIAAFSTTQQDRETQELSWSVAESGAWNPGDTIEGTDAEGTIQARISSVDTGANVLYAVPLVGSLSINDGFRVGMTIANLTTGGAIGAPGLTGVKFTTAAMAASLLRSGHWPSAADGSGQSGWRRFCALRKGMMGRRGGSLRFVITGQIFSTLPAGEFNILELIVVPRWKYSGNITSAIPSSGEAGGLRALPPNKRLGWQLVVPATASQGGIFACEIHARSVHPQTQIWWGRFIATDSVLTPSIGYADSALIDERLLPIYRSFIGSGGNQNQPESDDYNVGLCMRVDGSALASVTPPQPFAAVGVSTIKQDGSRIRLVGLSAEAWYAGRN